MQKRMLCLVLSFLLTATLVMAAGEKEKPEAAPPETGKEAPRYGGTINYYYYSNQGPVTADVYRAQWPTSAFIFYVIEPLIYNDIDGAGPRGSKETVFEAFETPLKWCTGALAESWEVSADKIVFHIRKGVKFQAMGKEQVMASRQMTADDVLQSLTRWLNDSPGHGTPGKMWARNGGWVESVSIDPNDPWTVVMKTNKFHAMWKEEIGNGWTNGIYAPEVVKTGLKDWDKLIGTGPWVLDEYIQDASMNFVRNPDYWDRTTVGGKEYKIPFADRLVLAIIPDVSTRIAALRAGKLDYLYGVKQLDKDSLDKTNPELLSTYFTERPTVVSLNVQSPILGKLQVRRALTMAIDRESIAKSWWGEGNYDMDAYPQLKSVVDVHTPWDQLPADVKEANTYNPEKAKQLLKEAGYPDGFALKMIIKSGYPDWVDGAIAIGEYWKAVGVTLNIEVMEAAAYSARLLGSGKAGAPGTKPEVLYDCLIDTNLPQKSAISPIFGGFAPSGYNYSNYYDEEFMEQFNKATATVDDVERNAILKKLSVKGYSAATVINLGAQKTYIMWQPWLKNYFGEMDNATFNQTPITARMWIDEELKKKLGK